MWDLPRPGLEPMSPALAGGFFTTAPPGKPSASLFFFFFNIYLFIYLFLAVLGLRFCARAFSSCGEQGPPFIATCGPLTVAASLVAAEHRLQTHRPSSCGSQAQLLRGMWDPPRPGLEPVSPALAGRFSTTAPPGKPSASLLIVLVSYSNRRSPHGSKMAARAPALCVSEIGTPGKQLLLLPRSHQKSHWAPLWL